MGRHVTQEWPRYNKGWSFSCIKRFWSRWTDFEAQVDGCAYGLEAPSGGKIKKPWTFKGTHPAIWQLQRRCTCTEKHVPLEGGQLCRMSALYTPALAKQYVRVCRTIKETQDCPEASVMAVRADYDPESLQSWTEQEMLKCSTELLKLHKKLGHPSRQSFVKMLRDRGASQWECALWPRTCSARIAMNRRSLHPGER